MPYTDMSRDHLRDFYEDEFNILDYWRVLFRRRKLIAVIVGVTLVASVIYSLLLPKYYASTARIFVPQQDLSLGAQILSQQSNRLSQLAANALSGETPADLWVGFLESQTLRDSIIDKFGLRKLYKAKTIEDARRALEANVFIDKSREGIIAITVEDQVPEKAAEMANAFIEELDRINQDVVMSTGRKTRLFIEKRLEEVKANLQDTENALQDFQETHKAIKLDAQSRTIIDAIGSVKGKLMAKEVELQTLLSFVTPSNPQVGVLKAEIGALRESLKELEEGNRGQTGKGIQGDIFIPTSRIPDLGIQYARLLRNFKIQETVFELLTQQYEMARVQEAKDSPTVQILDRGQVAEKKSRPNRRLIVTMSVLLAGFLTVVFVVFMEHLEQLKARENIDPI